MPSANYCPRCMTTFHGEPTACTNLACGQDKPDGGWDSVLAHGDVLDRHYLVDRCLAVGGAGLTYKARALDADGAPEGPDLAIKVLFAARDSGPFLRRLSNEAQILQALAHPNIVECHGFVSRFGHPPYLVTRFERGGSLQEHVERVGPLSPRVAAHVAFQVLSGLDVAHRAGVVHRDLKPDNVLLEEPVAADAVPHLKVADFGIAKVEAAVGDRLTRVGTFVGTPEYAAPEQFSGAADPTAATDVFACGGLLLFCLTGAVPVAFAHRMDLATSYRELLEHLPLQVPDGVGTPEERAALDALLERMTARYPEDRPSVGECLVALAPIAGLEAPRLPARKPPPPRPDPSLSHSDAPRPEAHLARGAAEAPGVAAGARARTTQPDPLSTPVALPRPDEPARRGGRRAGLAVGVMGLLGLAAAVVLVGVSVAGWQLGWFAPAPALVAPPPPVPSTPPAEVDLDAATDATSLAERAALAAALDEAGGPLRAVCGLSAAVPAELAVAADGRVTEVLISPAAGLDPPRRSCVDEKLRALTLPRTTAAPVRLRVRVGA